MSFYRTLLATAAAIALASPVFADDAATTTTSTENTATTTQSTEADGTQQTSHETTSSSMTETKINLNKATAKELMKIKGLNASKARAIVAYRKKHGDFKSVDELSSVKGFTKMKASKMKDIQDQLTVE